MLDKRVPELNSADLSTLSGNNLLLLIDVNESLPADRNRKLDLSTLFEYINSQLSIDGDGIYLVQGANQTQEGYFNVVRTNQIAGNSSLGGTTVSVVDGTKLSVREITANGPVFISAGGDSNNISLLPTGVGSLIVETGGTVQLRAAANGVRIYNSAGTFYSDINAEALTGNGRVNLANGTTTLIPGTMITASRTLQILTNNGLTGGSGELDLSENRTWALGLTGQALALHELSTSGLVTRSGANTIVAREFTVSGIGLSVSNGTGVAGNPNISINATSANTGNTVVSRDGFGNFTAGTITANLVGSASTAAALENSRLINGTSFNGTANITTSSWGTARSISIGGTLKLVDGSENVTWNTSEIAAQTAVRLNTARLINGTSFDGTSDVTTANWGSGRNITIGGTTRSVNGSTTYSWSLADIGVSDASLTLNTSGIATGAQTWTANQASNATFTVNVPGTNLSFTNGSSTGPVITSSTGSSVTIPSASGTTSGIVTTETQTFAGVKTFLAEISGSVSGNAGTATRLATARTINGQSFDGSANITVSASPSAGSVVDSSVAGNAAIALSKLGTGNLPSGITVTSANIVDDTIVNADINAAAAIAHSKLASITSGHVLIGGAGNVPTATQLTGDLSVAGNGAVTLSNSGVSAGTYTKVTVDTKGRVTTGASLSASDVPTITASKISDFNTQVQTNRLSQLAEPLANVTLNGYKITNLAEPTSPSDAASKAYVDASQQGLIVKDAVRVATTANITLSGTQTIDGVAVIAGNRVLAKNQSTASQNGVYVVAAGTWSRSTDADTSPEVTTGMFVFVEEGAANANSGWILQTPGPITLGTTDLAFAKFSGAGQIEGGAGLTKSGNTLDIGTASVGRIVINADNIDLATAGTAGTYRSVTTDAYGRVTSGTNPTTLAGYGITDAASNTHVHGNITNDGRIGSTANLPIITTTGGALTAGAFGSTSGTFCQGNDARLSDQRVPTDSSVTNAKIASNAAIDYSKLASITAGQLLLGNVSNVATPTSVSGDITINSSGVTSISSGVIVNADISGSAEIAHTKLAAITAGRLLMGNASNVPTATAVTGDVTINSSGVTLISSGVITDSNISGSAAIALSKLGPGSLPGTISIASANIVDGTIVNADISASAGIVDTKLATISTAGKVSNSATTATNNNTSSAIVARDASGNFAAGVISANLSGNASTASALETGRLVNGTSFNGSANITTNSWGTARNITIGATTRSVDGSTVYNWTLADIGVNNATLTLNTSGIATGSTTWTANQGSSQTFTVNVPGTNLSFTGGTTSGPVINTSTGTGATVPSASGSASGVVTTGAQTFAGAKTFNDSVTGSAFIPTGGSVPTNGIYLPTANTLGVAVNNTERFRIDSSGRLLFGRTSSRQSYVGNTAVDSPWQLESATEASFTLCRISASGVASSLFLQSGRGTPASPTISVSGDVIGEVGFGCYNGTNFRSAAKIEAYVEGTPSGSSTPGRLVLSTTPAGSQISTERLRITSDGKVLIGNTNGTESLSVTGTASFSTRSTTPNAYSDGVVARDGIINGMVSAGSIDLPGANTNLHLRSQDFSTNWLATTGATLSVNAGIVTPDLTTGAGSFLCSDTSSVSRRLYPVLNINTLSGTQYTYSIYLKSVNNWRYVCLSATTGTGVTGGTNANFDIIDGIAYPPAGVDCSIASVGGGWWRLSVTTTGNTDTTKRPKVILIGAATDTASTTVAGVVNAGVYAWGAQLSPVSAGQTSALGPYIPTTTATVSNVPGYLKVAGNQVVNSRKTGWAAATGTPTRSTFVTSTVTTAQLAERVKALIDDLIAHGLIGA